MRAHHHARCVHQARHLYHLQRAIVDIDRGSGDHHFAAALERDARGIEGYGIAIVSGDDDLAGIVVEQDFVLGNRNDGFDMRPSLFGLGAIEPEATGPYRQGDVAAFELDPHAAADFGEKCHAYFLARVRDAGHAPAGRAAPEHLLHLGLDSQGRRIDIGDDAAVLAEEAVAQALVNVEDRLLVHVHGSPPKMPPPVDAGPTALRASTKRILCASCVIVWRTLHTRYSPECTL